MSTGQAVGGVVGAAIGAFAGNPVMGAQIGMMIGGYLDPPKGPTVNGPTLSDLTIQTSTYGAAIPRVYGTIAISGNILWLENDKLKPTVHKEEQGGKGGGSTQTVKTTTYSATFAIGICLGEIAGVRRIWCADKLIYNAGSGDLETIIAGNKNAKGWRLYLGTDDQQPDHRYESDVGVGNAPAFRGLAYIVFDDFQLEDYGNTLQAANFKFEVMSAAAVVGLRKVLDTPSGMTYSDAPYIYNAESVMFASDDETTSRLFSEGGTSKLSFDAAPDNTLPSAPGVLSAGRAGNRVVGGKLTNLTYMDGADFGFVDVALSPQHIGITSTSLAGKKLLGFTVSTAGSLVFVCFTDDTNSIYGGAPGTWHVLDSSLDEISHGTFSNETAYSIGAGVSARYHFMASVLSSDGRYLYTAYGAGDRELTAIKLADFSKTVLTGALYSAGTFFRPAIYERDGIIYVLARGYAYHFVMPPQVTPNTVPLQDIIGAEVALSSLIGAGDINLSLLTDSVTGYRVSGGSIRSAIEPLQGAFPFDVIQSGYKIKAVPRGQSVVATIPWGDLGATDGSPGVMLEQSREMDSQLPYRVAIKYLDQAREYAVSEQYAERSFTGAVNRVDRELPIVMSADKASSVAETLLFLPHLERVDMAFKLPPTYAALEPSDVVTVATQDATYSVRLTEINYGSTGLLECKGKPNAATIYQSTAIGAEAPGPDGTIPLAGTSVFVPLDIPVIDETQQNSAGFIGAMSGYTDGWPGAVLVRSVDGGQTWVDVQGFTGKATIGMTQDILPASSGALIDLRTLNVLPMSGEFYSVTYDQMLGGVNYAAYGRDGRWEIVRFQNAVLQVDGSYDISGFIRGERGTEWATGLHAANDYFILLDDPDLIFMGAAVEIIGTELDYRAVTSGESVDSATDQPFAYKGVNLECLSPIYPAGTRDGSSNFSGSFTRRSRLSSSWWTSGVPAPVGEATEAYEIDVMDGATVKRTIAVSSPDFTYSAADQATDFGSAQSSITFKIYQLSAVVGRGYPLEVTL